MSAIIEKLENYDEQRKCIQNELKSRRVNSFWHAKRPNNCVEPKDRRNEFCDVFFSITLEI